MGNTHTFWVSRELDYSPFGMITVGRSWSLGSSYRYGFNGQEEEDEISGDGNSNDFEFRNYDSRLGRFKSVDPLSAKYPMYTPYAFAANQPIHSGDIEGLENPDDKNTTVTTDINSSDKSNIDNNQSNWTFSAQPGWVTNIDFVVGSTSGNYLFNKESTGIEGSFSAYDSKENYKKLEGDQANKYLFTAKNEGNGFMITSGVLHDKREQVPSTTGNIFRYTKGGLSPTFMLGKELDFDLSLSSKVGVSTQVGGFVSFNDIQVDLASTSNSYSHLSSGGKNRTYSGGGLVAMSNVSFSFVISKSWSASVAINGTYMVGKAYTTVQATDNSTGAVSEGALSVTYSSFSVGPSIAVNFRR